jgi:protein AroM
MQSKLDELEARGVSLTVVICTGEFPAFNSKRFVFTPQEMIKGVLRSSLRSGRLGVVYPAGEQVYLAEVEYGYPGVEVVGDWVSPYEGDYELSGLADRLNEKKLDLILLNCFGYSGKVKRVINEATGVPTILSSTLIARVVQELL